MKTHRRLGIQGFSSLQEAIAYGVPHEIQITNPRHGSYRIEYLGPVRIRKPSLHAGNMYDLFQLTESMIGAISIHDLEGVTPALNAGAVPPQTTGVRVPLDELLWDLDESREDRVLPEPFSA